MKLVTDPQIHSFMIGLEDKLEGLKRTTAEFTSLLNDCKFALRAGSDSPARERITAWLTRDKR